MPVVAHVVRDYGRPTEPFIRHRVNAALSGYTNELWCEVEHMRPPVATRHVRMRWARSGSSGDRLFHAAPRLARVLAGDYKRLESEHRPVLIHAHYIPTAYLVGEATRTPMVASAYGWDLSTLPRKRVWSAATKRLAQRIDRLLVEGPHMRRTAISLGMSPEQVSIVRISAGLEAITFRPPRLDPELAPRFICPGRMVEKKGQEFALRAFAALTPKLPVGSQLVLLGSGRLEPMLRALARELGVVDQVDFPGAMPREAYLEQQAAADIMLAPSTTGPNGDSEGGAPTTILDAHAAGTITIGSRHADIPYLIEDGVTGYLCEEGDVEALATAVERALAERERWTSIADEARRRAIERHSDDAVSHSLQGIYEEVLRSG